MVREYRTGGTNHQGFDKDGRKPFEQFEAPTRRGRPERAGETGMQCIKHSFERAVDLCEACGNAMCVKCLVYPHGSKKPPYCITCALVVSGVKHAKASPLPKREIKKLRKEFVVVPATTPVESEALERPVQANPNRQIEWCA